MIFLIFLLCFGVFYILYGFSVCRIIANTEYLKKTVEKKKNSNFLYALFWPFYLAIVINDYNNPDIEYNEDYIDRPYIEASDILARAFGYPFRVILGMTEEEEKE